MKTVFAFFCLLALLLPTAGAQQPSQGPKIDPSNPNRVQLEETLQRYLAAYAHKNFQELVLVWPDLPNDKKEAEKIRRHLEDGNVTDELMSVQPLETISLGDGAVVRAQRTEQFVRTERSSSITNGDLHMGSMPVQDPGPHQVEKKKTIKKTDTVWIKFHQAGDSWTIVSITTQKPQ